MKIERQDTEEHVGLEGLETGPGAAVKAEGAFGGGYDAFDTGAPLAQTLVGAFALDQFAKRVAFEGGERDVLHAQGAGFCGVGFAGESAVGGDVFGGLFEAVPMALEGGDERLRVGAIASLDDAIEEEVALAAGEQDLVAVDDFALSLFDDVGVGFEEGDDFLLGPKSAGKTSGSGTHCLLTRPWLQGIGQVLLDRGERGTVPSRSLLVARLVQSPFLRSGLRADLGRRARLVLSLRGVRSGQ